MYFQAKRPRFELQIISSRFRLYLRKLSVFFHKFGSYVKLCCSSSKHAYSHYSPFARKSVVSSRLRAEVSRVSHLGFCIRNSLFGSSPAKNRLRKCRMPTQITFSLWILKNILTKSYHKNFQLLRLKNKNLCSRQPKLR